MLLCKSIMFAHINVLKRECGLAFSYFLCMEFQYVRSIATVRYWEIPRNVPSDLFRQLVFSLQERIEIWLKPLVDLESSFEFPVHECSGWITEFFIVYFFIQLLWNSIQKCLKSGAWPGQTLWIGSYTLKRVVDFLTACETTDLAEIEGLSWSFSNLFAAFWLLDQFGLSSLSDLFRLIYDFFFGFSRVPERSRPRRTSQNTFFLLLFNPFAPFFGRLFGLVSPPNVLVSDLVVVKQW